jgi:hypothetical protein
MATTSLLLVPSPPRADDAPAFTHNHTEHIMENNVRIVQRHTGAWRLQVWTSFGIALLVCGTGLAWLPGGDLDRAFMVMGYFFCLSSAFTLAKTLRDAYEADRLERALRPQSTPAAAAKADAPAATL